MPSGASDVSECRTSTSSTATPRRSATIIAHEVSWPWPWGEAPVTTWTLLVGRMRTVADSQPPAE
jgi:hypothetical protein